MYVNPYNSLSKTDIPCEEREIKVARLNFLGLIPPNFEH